MALTRRQREVLDVVRELIETNGYSPSLEEIGAELGLSSVATVHKHVSHLVQKGYVRRTWNQNRSIELVESEERQGAVRLPLTGTISSASTVETVAEGESVVVPAEMIEDPAAGYVLRVVGDRMIEARLENGDLLILERREAGEGDSVVASLEGRGPVLGRFRIDGTRTGLEPYDAETEAITAASSAVRVQGVVVGMVRRY
jgi:repressor LexA